MDTANLLDRPRSIIVKCEGIETRKGCDWIWEALGQPEGAFECIQVHSKSSMTVTLKRMEDVMRILEIGELEKEEGKISFQRAGADVKVVMAKGLPFEMSPQQVSSGYSRYGKVMSVTRDRIKEEGYLKGVFNGTYLVKLDMKKEVPNFFWFGRFTAYNYYQGVRQTCRKCGQEGHWVTDCTAKVCWNCREVTEHYERNCQKPCGACGSQDHKRSDCTTKTWANVVAKTVEQVADERNKVSEAEPVKEKQEEEMDVTTTKSGKRSGSPLQNEKAKGKKKKIRGKGKKNSQNSQSESSTGEESSEEVLTNWKKVATANHSRTTKANQREAADNVKPTNQREAADKVKPTNQREGTGKVKPKGPESQEKVKNGEKEKKVGKEDTNKIPVQEKKGPKQLSAEKTPEKVLSGDRQKSSAATKERSVTEEKGKNRNQIEGKNGQKQIPVEKTMEKEKPFITVTAKGKSEKEKLAEKLGVSKEKTVEVKNAFEVLEGLSDEEETDDSDEEGSSEEESEEEEEEISPAQADGRKDGGTGQAASSLPAR